MRTKFSWPAALLTVAAVMTAGCSTHREFRVASVGSDGSFEIAGDDDGWSHGARMTRTGSTRSLVASGNVLIGNGAPILNANLVNGTVTGILAPTGQTLVQLVNGTALVLNGVGGTAGDVVAIDLGAARVVAGPTRLVGANVLSTSAVTRVATGVTTSGTGTVRTVTAAVSGRSTGTRSVTSSVTSTVTGTVGGALPRPCC